MRVLSLFDGMSCGQLALQKAGIDVPYMVKDDEGHGFYNEENQFDFYRAMEKFLNKHLN